MAKGKTEKTLSVAKQQKMAVEEAERLIQAAKKSGEDLTVEEIDEALPKALVAPEAIASRACYRSHSQPLHL